MFAIVRPGRWDVERATGPRKADLRSRFGFWPNRAAEQAEIFELHEQGLEFVGDWHTHPEKVPRPSDQDLQGIRSVVELSKHHLPGFLMCIVGLAPEHEGLWLSFHASNGDMIVAQPVDVKIVTAQRAEP